MEILGPDARKGMLWLVKPWWKLLLYAGAIAAIYLIPSYGPRLLSMAVLEAGLLLHVVGFQLIFAAVSVVFTIITYKMFFGKHVESVTPLASAFRKTEALFDKEHDEQLTKAYTDGGLRFLLASGPVVCCRTIATVLIFAVYMWALNHMMVLLSMEIML